MSDLRVTTRNARFQQWEALLGNRTKRQRTGEFLVHGVRPITLAVEHGWPLSALLYPAGRRLSKWAGELLDTVRTTRVSMDPDLLAELGEKEDEAPELIAVAQLPPDDLDRIPVPEDFLGVVFDRPASPGNIGTIIRSADAFGAHGVIVAGHAADVYDPRTVRASTGSLFALPVVRAESAGNVLEWIRAQPVTVRIVGTDEHGTAVVDRHDLTGPTLLVVGNETAGMSNAWRAACDDVLSIPIGGAASSLNAANAASIVLYEVARQRRL
ncbi:TrmH family RNA methyltransferase [Kutzneria kofuensis]|uniref:TrmH family RNA methyltransferase n=1 Tax=Kutzneria kofuensis TaxID=103725 RepID=A0A7W9KS80_9PSEU|nr:TrmH family RNA methyltransferase [Kutzneria kofuensis]MBB5897765.1 TrmH family RNA methyltransferase [Kutzneria kofuensis]